jgi:hypothetical protein
MYIILLQLVLLFNIFDLRACDCDQPRASLRAASPRNGGPARRARKDRHGPGPHGEARWRRRYIKIHIHIHIYMKYYADDTYWILLESYVPVGCSGEKLVKKGTKYQ